MVVVVAVTVNQKDLDLALVVRKFNSRVLVSSLVMVLVASMVDLQVIVLVAVVVDSEVVTIIIVVMIHSIHQSEF